MERTKSRRSPADFRDRFLKICNRIGLPVTSFAGKASGSDEDRRPVYADVTLAGSPDAPDLLILAPAAGNEAGAIASGLACEFFETARHARLNRNACCLVIHAINPLGPIWPPLAEFSDHQALPPSDEWENIPLLTAETGFPNKADKGTFGSRLDRERLAPLPLSAMALPGWRRNIVEQIEKGWMIGRRQITLLDCRVAKPAEGGSVGYDYAERTLPGPMGDLNHLFGGRLNRVAFDQIPSAGLINRAGQTVNALVVNFARPLDFSETVLRGDLERIFEGLLNGLGAASG